METSVDNCKGTDDSDGKEHVKLLMETPVDSKEYIMDNDNAKVMETCVDNCKGTNDNDSKEQVMDNEHPQHIKDNDSKEQIMDHDNGKGTDNSVDNDNGNGTDSSVDNDSKEHIKSLMETPVETKEQIMDNENKELIMDNDNGKGTDNSEEGDLSDGSEQEYIPPVHEQFHLYNIKRTAPVDDYAEFPGHKRFKQKIEIEDVVTEHVLPFLPAKSLSRFRSVSREWDQMITSPFFSHKQANQFRDISGLFGQLPGDPPFFVSLNRDAYGVPSPSLSFLPDPVTVRTSCNGLLCCQSCNGENTYYICNPVTKEWRALPKSNFYHGPEPALALAFEPSVLNFAAHYQLVCAFPLSDHPVISFEIFSSRSSSWRLADTECCELDALKLNGDGLFMTGVAFWETSAGAILAFDLNEEQYGILSLPPNSGPNGVLTEMNKELCYILPRREYYQYTLDIYGDVDMNLKHSISLDSEFFKSFTGEMRALACVNSDVVMIELERTLFAYHVKAGRVENLGSDTSWSDDGYVRYLPYVNSLVHVRRSYMSSLSSVDPTTELSRS